MRISRVLLGVPLAAMLALPAIAVSASAQASAVSGVHYVALGDSYSSGQGLSPYQSDSNYSYNGMTSSCNRSISQAYPDLVKSPGSSTSIAQQAATPGSGDEFSFLACAGQWTTQVTESAADEQSAPSYGQVNQAPMQNVPAWNQLDLGYYELPQADQGFLTSNTKLVTLTVGGDDARFAPLLAGCTTVASPPLTKSAADVYLSSSTMLSRSAASADDQLLVELPNKLLLPPLP